MLKIARKRREKVKYIGYQEQKNSSFDDQKMASLMKDIKQFNSLTSIDFRFIS